VTAALVITSTPTPFLVTLISVDASHGSEPGGYSVTLTGSNFTNSAAVSFGANNAVVTSKTSTQIVVTVPAGIGTVFIVVTQGGDASNALSFLYDAPVTTPTLTNTPTASLTPIFSQTFTPTPAPKSGLTLSVNQLNNLTGPPLIINYHSSGGLVDLRIYIPTADSIRHLCNCVLPSGNQTFYWDAKDDRGEPVRTGLYLVVALESGHAEIKKVLVVKQ